MQRILSKFRGLGWKLTLSYTLVTVAALVVVEVVGLGAIWYMVERSDFLPQIAADNIVRSAAQLAPFLDEEPIDRSGIESWLMRVEMEGFTSRDAQGQTTSFVPDGIVEGGEQIWVLDAQRQVAASLPANADPRLISGSPAAVDQLFERALQGEQEHTRLYTTTPDRNLWIVAPVMTEANEVVGLLVFRGAMLANLLPFGELARTVGGSLIVFTLAAGLVGTLFGFFTARTLSRRLKTMALAADAWSQGDFTVFVKDSSLDEIGQLSRRLNRMAEQLQNLMHTRQELAGLEERNHLARELHDSVKQQVFATAMQLGAARALLDRDPETARKHLAEAEALARQAQAELTGLIRELRPANLQGQGLGPAVKEQAAAWMRQTGIQANVGLKGERRLPLDIEQSLYRLVQEALSNAARHSEAKQVEIHLAWEPQAVSLDIRDDGCGFNPAEVLGKGQGLRSMRERVEGLGGSFELEAAPGRGARLHARIPVPAVPNGQVPGE